MGWRPHKLMAIPGARSNFLFCSRDSIGSSPQPRKCLCLLLPVQRGHSPVNDVERMRARLSHSHFLLLCSAQGWLQGNPTHSHCLPEPLNWPHPTPLSGWVLKPTGNPAQRVLGPDLPLKHMRGASSQTALVSVRKD